MNAFGISHCLKVFPKRRIIPYWGIEDGGKEVLSIVNHSTEGAVCWKEELEALKDRMTDFQRFLSFSSSIQQLISKFVGYLMDAEINKIIV